MGPCGVSRSQLPHARKKERRRLTQSVILLFEFHKSRKTCNNSQFRFLSPWVEMRFTPASTVCNASPTPKPLVGSTQQLTTAVTQPTTASLLFNASTSLGCTTEGNTAARTIAASTAFGV